MRHRHSVTENPSQLALVASVAAVVGAITALLVSPHSSNKIRENVRSKTAQLKDTFLKNDTAVDDARQVTDDVVKRAKSTASKVTDDVKTTTQKVKDDSKKSVDEAKSAGRAVKNDK